MSEYLNSVRVRNVKVIPPFHSLTYHWHHSEGLLLHLDLDYNLWWFGICTALSLFHLGLLDVTVNWSLRSSWLAPWLIQLIMMAYQRTWGSILPCQKGYEVILYSLKKRHPLLLANCLLLVFGHVVFWYDNKYWPCSAWSLTFHCGICPFFLMVSIISGRWLQQDHIETFLYKHWS